jgi:hypothetical protein
VEPVTRGPNIGPSTSQQAVRDVDDAIGIDPGPVAVEREVVDRAQREAVHQGAHGKDRLNRALDGSAGRLPGAAVADRAVTR